MLSQAKLKCFVNYIETGYFIPQLVSEIWDFQESYNLIGREHIGQKIKIYFLSDMECGMESEILPSPFIFF